MGLRDRLPITTRSCSYAGTLISSLSITECSLDPVKWFAAVVVFASRRAADSSCVGTGIRTHSSWRVRRGGGGLDAS